MRAFAIDKYKDPLTLRDMPGLGEVVVVIATTSVNRFDAQLRDRAFKALLPMPLITVAG